MKPRLALLLFGVARFSLSADQSWLRGYARWAGPLAAWAAVMASSVVLWHTAAFLWFWRPVLPVFDGWAPWTSLRDVLDGSLTPFAALTAFHNEHRVVLARALFVADLFAGGRDQIAVAASLSFQALQCSIWIVLLAWAGGPRWLRLAAAAAAVAMLSTLRQGDNFVSGFQSQFTGVFALDVAAAFLLLGGRGPSAAGFAAAGPAFVGGVLVAVEPLAMANGLLAGPACAVVGSICRTPGSRRAAAVGVAASACSLSLNGPSNIFGHHGFPFGSAVTVVLHATAYLGGTLTSGRVSWALAAGLAGLASFAVALVLAVRGGIETPAERVALQVMAFCVLSAAATAYGRVSAGFGVEQALSGRYATASGTFWSATLVFWVARLGAKPTPAGWRGVLACFAACAVLLAFAIRDQHSYDRSLGRQGAAAARILDDFLHGRVLDGSDLMAVGVDDVTARADMILIGKLRSASAGRP